MSLLAPTVVREFDSHDVALLQAWWEIGRAASASRAVDLWTPWEQAETLWTLPPVDREIHTFGAFEAGDRTGHPEAMVGAGRLILPEKDNTHLAFVEVFVLPDRAREGIGRSLVEVMEEVGAARERTTYLASTFSRPGDDASSSLAFAQAQGYPVVAREEIKLVDLAATEQTWPALEAEAAERLGDYELVWWADSTPPEHVADRLALLTRFLDEIPLEGADLHAQQWDESKLRRTEQRRLSSGYHQLVVAARAPDGHLVGYSDALRGESTPGWAGIDGTLVLPEHRGHRLGLAMKVRLHQLVREEFRGCRVIMTGNAGVNEHMNAVNARLGYDVVEVELAVQKVLGAAGPG